jgi:hypothetical protein
MNAKNLLLALAVAVALCLVAASHSEAAPVVGKPIKTTTQLVTLMPDGTVIVIDPSAPRGCGLGIYRTTPTTWNTLRKLAAAGYDGRLGLYVQDGVIRAVAWENR